ncbi:hypothetical protein MRB53_003873 [Persea americana]|uniref:Uncharacterized protein n=1 Tax=Persea americana TaxID=3435 RepID=A0ACC2MYX9_PERAE|nr:hypothetical protein MRB53_003873 [Persea americana]
MGNSLRCCLACFLPCGALDVIRIVHLNGHVEELSHPILVKEVINANPNHVLTMPCPQGLGHKILILSPNSELKRGHFYFLIPASAIPNNNKSTNTTNKKRKPSSKLHKIKTMEEEDAKSIPPRIKGLSEKKRSCRDQRQASGIGIWRPNLESIYED